ncbi:MAG: hypothetical protein J6W65_03355, partial [Oscillospiraceae bacterium]|nr:hypothetical protein [Oscillospiraceae bacterium]
IIEKIIPTPNPLPGEGAELSISASVIIRFIPVPERSRAGHFCFFDYHIIPSRKEAGPDISASLVIRKIYI